MIGVSSPGNSYLSSKLAKLQLHQLDQLLVVHHVAFVQKHHDARYTHLTGQQNVLAGLGHRTVVGRHHQNRAVHLRRTGDHVLDIVRMARAVHVRVMAGVRLILHVGRGDRNAALFFLRRLVNLIKRNKLGFAFQPLCLVIAAVNVVLP
jgi:hypothetical protein